MSPIIYLGNGAIALAIGLSLLGVILYAVARLDSHQARQAHRLPSGNLAATARGTIYANFILMTVANLAMVYALLSNDFGVSYVAHVGAIETPRWISAISLWSSLEGSILFWGWILTAYSAVCIYFYRERDGSFWFSVGIVLLVVQIFFYLLLAFPANPFQAVIPPPPNGPGPNPLLQNHWLMAIHPPCLYLGYIGFTVPFAFAIATLIERESISRREDPALPVREATSGGLGDRPWPSPILMIRRWLLFAWSFQSVAIMLGGWWSYAVLGWGGYWAWDPVENASLMPWLAGTALVHSVIVEEKRGILSVWNLTLAVVTFLLTLLGTFLTRSGVLDSVHSFTESHVGPYFLVFIGIVLMVSLYLLLWQGPKFRKPGRIENLFSLEVLFLFNNLLFVSFCFVVFLGTLYPLVVEALQGKRISVGEPYFNQMTVPLAGMILLVLSVGLATPWKKGNVAAFWRTTRLPALIALLSAAGSVALGVRSVTVGVILFLAGWACWIMAFELGRLCRRISPWKLLRENPRRYGGFISHAGMLILIAGVALSSVYETDREVTLKQGESAEIGRYTLALTGIEGNETPQRFEIGAEVVIYRRGKEIGTLRPRMNFYPTSREPIPSPAVVWIWMGGVIVIFGGLLALAFGQRRENP